MLGSVPNGAGPIMEWRGESSGSFLFFRVAEIERQIR